MRKKVFVSLASVFLAAASFSGAEAIAGIYTTNFPLTENPISERGHWVNGKTVGLDWNDISTTPGLAIGHEPGNVNYADATALLTGTWGADQTAQATVDVGTTYDSDYPEVELRLRSTLSAHTCSGYEISFKATTSSSAYLIIVRWNGPFGNFTVLTDLSGSQYRVANGDIVKATIVGKTITGYINGVSMAQVTDTTYANGNPGMGFNFYCSSGTCLGTNSGYGFTTFTASDSADTTIPSPPTNLRILP